VKCRWALFLSGRGSTAQALMDLLGDLDLRLVVSSRAKAAGLLKARRSGIPTLVLEKDQNWTLLSKELKQRGIQKIFLVGFMRILPADFIKEWTGRVWNVHPSLLPAFTGAKALERCFEEESEMGVTIHEVNAEMDAGQRCLQARLPRSRDWTVTTERAARLEQRLLREWAQRMDLSVGSRS
jgi:phosphoribosylglycinamide formyltransferase-1